jgi:anti-sigma B factor antagonist
VSSSGEGRQIPLAVDQIADGVAVIAVSCELDMLTVPAFEQMLARESRAGHRVLIVDLSGCQFMGSSGLATLVEAHDRGKREGVAFALAGLTRTLTRGIEITGLDTLFDIYPSVEQAETSLNSS